jgi:hypothetical protein
MVVKTKPASPQGGAGFLMAHTSAPLSSLLEFDFVGDKDPPTSGPLGRQQASVVAIRGRRNEMPAQSAG